MYLKSDEERTPRRLSAVVVAALTVVFVLTCLRCRPTAPKSYNVLLVTIDTLRADHVGAYGAREASTPALDALAARGVRFDDAMTASPLTLPSHATILSGLLPPHHTLRNNGAGEFPQSRATLATEFSSAGYRTAAFVGAFVLDHRFGLNRGFDTYDDEIDRGSSPDAVLEAERPANAVIDRALAWLGRDDTRPFFAWVHLFDPHAPYMPPEPYASRFKSDPYAGEIAFADAELGRLVAELDRRGLRENTIIVVSGDHGESLGEHGELTHGLLLYQPTLHVPLIVAAPGKLGGRGIIRTPVSLADIAPTVASMAGAPLTGTDGSDLSTALARVSEPEARELYAETEYPTLFGWSGLSALRRGNFKYIAAPRPELYDVAGDRGETRNLRDAERRQTVQLSAALTKLASTAVPTAPATLDDETKAKLASLGYVSPSTSTQTSGPRPDPKDMAPLFHEFEQATWALSAGDVVSAKQRLERIVASDPANPVFRTSLARTCRKSGDLGRAIELYRDAVGSNPSDADAWYNLATALQEDGRAKDAGVAIREALRRDPRRPEAHNALGSALAAEGEFDAALAEFDKAISLDPRNAHAYNNRGNVYRATNRLDEARAAYAKAAEFAPNYSDPLNGLGTVEVQADRPVIAIPYFDRALALSPESHEILLNRAIAYEMAGNRATAMDEYRKFLDVTGQDPQYSSQRQAARQLLARLAMERKIGSLPGGGGTAPQ